MRRTLAGFIAFLAMTGTFVVLPVYAAPAPAARPVEPSIDEVALGSVAQPQGDAVVTTDGEPDRSGTSAAPSSTPGGATPTTAPTTAPRSTSAPEPEDVASSGKELPGVPALTVSQPDTDTFYSVGVTWEQGDVTDVQVQLRVKRSSGKWGGWTTITADDVEQTPTGETADNETRGGTAPYWTGEGHGVEVIVQGAGGVVPGDVKVALVDPGKSAADKLPQAPAARDQAHAAEVMPAVYSRAQWGADESIRSWDPQYASTIKAATIHHTADRNDYTADEVPAIMRAMYAYHTLTRGWGDIGYNVVVDRFGRIFEGRYGGLASTVIGAHAGGFNTYTFGVSMLGNFDEVPVPQATVNAVAEIIAWKLGLYGVDPRGTTTLVAAGGAGTTSKYPNGTAVKLPTIFAHRDVGNTVCPGQYGYARMGEIRDRVAARFPLYDTRSVLQKNSTTGNITDLSPMTVASVVSANGATTAFVRGTDGAIHYRTGRGTGSYSPYYAIPGDFTTSGPAAVSSDGVRVDLVVRATGGVLLQTSSTLDATTGMPGIWAGWKSLGGALTAAPGIASVGPDRLAVAARGTDGSIWERVYDGSDWSSWTPLGGLAFSAPSVEADYSTGAWQYRVTVVGNDLHSWTIPTGSTHAGAVGPWSGGRQFSSHGIGNANTSAPVWTPKVQSTGGGDHSVVLVEPTSAWIAGLGGYITSTASVSRQPDGSVLVFGRGSDKALWVIRYDFSTGAGTWTSLSGVVA